jgi:hypothetical protein
MTRARDPNPRMRNRACSSASKLACNVIQPSGPLRWALLSAGVVGEGTTDAHLLTPWAFKMGGKAVAQNSRDIMIADAVFSHLAHHRGQLTVYLRLADSTVPALYGPSADERF